MSISTIPKLNFSLRRLLSWSSAKGKQIQNFLISSIFGLKVNKSKIHKNLKILSILNKGKQIQNI